MIKWLRERQRLERKRRKITAESERDAKEERGAGEKKLQKTRKSIN